MNRSLFCIADKINKQAHEKEGFQPFYAFQGDIYSPTYTKELTEKTNKFLSILNFQALLYSSAK